MGTNEVCDQYETPLARTQTNTCQPPYIPARILWPALGFPEVVDAIASATADDHTASIHVLLIAATDKLSPFSVARHLRWVSWDQRRTRFLPPGTQSFPREQITVAKATVSVVQPDWTTTNELTNRVDMANGSISIALAKRVLSFYQNLWKTFGVYEVTISQSASASVPAGLNNLIWINRTPRDTEVQRSEEMNDLLENFVKPRLKQEFPPEKWLRVPASSPFKNSDEMAMDYEFEWPSSPGVPRSADTALPAQTAVRRVEVLHPLFMGPWPASGRLRISHVTDTHVSTSHDVLELRAHSVAPVDEWAPKMDEISPANSDDDRLLEGWEKKQQTTQTMLPKDRWKSFNNINRRFDEVYKNAKNAGDILLMTGDLTDYSRGHIGDPNAVLGEIGNYWLDRNWFLFYRLLAQDALYSKPVYTSLGNHDWRLNPYPPVSSFFKMSEQFNLTDAELERLHGRGADQWIYNDSWTDYIKAAVDWAMTEDRPDTTSDRMPVVTTTEAVIWYMLVINPFLDYSVRLPGDFALLTLDWARTEQLLGDGVPLRSSSPILIKSDPMAANALSQVQQQLVDHFIQRNVKAKILTIHSPVIGPNNWWPTQELETGWITIDGQRFPIIALGDSNDWETPFQAPPSDHLPAFGSIKRFRYWLLNKLRDSKASLVLSGHLHRHAMFFIVNPEKAKPGQNLQAGMAIRVHTTDLNSYWFDHGPPLFINSTCAGPVGHDVQVAKKWLTVRPGFTQITMENDGRVIDVQELYADWTM